MEDDPLAPTVTATPSEPAIGRGELQGRIGDRYEIVKFLGAGGMGSVYLALDLKLLQQVALKVVAKQLRNDPEVLARVRDEVALAQKVTHRNVCRTHDLEEIDGQYLVKMEYVVGVSLAERLRKGPLPLGEV